MIYFDHCKALLYFCASFYQQNINSEKCLLSKDVRLTSAVLLPVILGLRSSKGCAKQLVEARMAEKSASALCHQPALEKKNTAFNKV